MNRAAGRKLAAYLTIATLLVGAALVFGRPELIAVAAPLIVAMLVGLGASRQPSIDVRASVDVDRCLEGDEVVTTIFLTSDKDLYDVEVALQVPDSFVSEGSARRVLSLKAGAVHEEAIAFAARHWGTHPLGIVALRVWGPGRFAVWEQVTGRATPVKVFPSIETIRKGLSPPDTQVFAGNYVARSAGAGIEFSHVRPFQRGDRVKSVNWRVTTRRNALHVNEFHPERNSDIVVFLDTFGDYGTRDLGSLEIAVRGASGLVRHYLKRKDRVGLVAFGGVLRWITVSMARTQVYRIVDALLESQALFSFVWKDVDLLPHGTLPPSALIVAFSPLVDKRSTDAIKDLFARGFPLVVIDTLPEEEVAAERGPEGALARRVWMLQRETIRAEMQAGGIPVLRWWEANRLDAVLQDLPRVPTRRDLVRS